MAVTVKQVWEAHPLLAELCRGKLPYQAARRVSRILKEVRDHVESVNEAREALVAEFAEEGGNEVPRERLVEFAKRWREILAEVLEDFTVTPVPAKDFTDRWEVSPDTLLALQEIGAIKEDE